MNEEDIVSAAERVFGAKAGETELEPKELERLAYSLVGYFDLLVRVDSRHKFGNSSHRAIDTSNNSVLDREEVK